MYCVPVLQPVCETGCTNLNNAPARPSSARMRRSLGPPFFPFRSRRGPAQHHDWSVLRLTPHSSARGASGTPPPKPSRRALLECSGFIVRVYRLNEFERCVSARVMPLKPGSRVYVYARLRVILTGVKPLRARLTVAWKFIRAACATMWVTEID